MRTGSSLNATYRQKEKLTSEVINIGEIQTTSILNFVTKRAATVKPKCNLEEGSDKGQGSATGRITKCKKKTVEQQPKVMKLNY